MGLPTMVTRTFEIYMLHELDSDEEAYLHRTAINLEIDLSIAHSNRLITIEGMRDIYEVIHFPHERLPPRRRHWKHTRDSGLRTTIRATNHSGV